MALAYMVVGFVIGALAILSVEGFAILYIVRRLIQGNKSTQVLQGRDSCKQLETDKASSSTYQIEGPIWVLEPQEVPKIPVPGDNDSRKDVLEVFPVRKFAKIKDRSLFFIEPDGSQTTILMKGCRIVAVSASGLSSKKWAKRFPIKVESKGTTLYNGSRSLYMYLETSWEKESWCKALRFASGLQEERTNWFKSLPQEFQHYVRSLSEVYPSLMKPSSGHHTEFLERITKADAPSSKVRQLWKKIAKKASKTPMESALVSNAVSVNHVKGLIEQSSSHQDIVNVPFSGRNSSTEKSSSNDAMDDSSVSSTGRSSLSGSHDQVPELPGADPYEQYSIDGGTLCWNLLISRLFFDARRNSDIKDALKFRIQRLLSSMRTPSFIGELTCTDVDSGHLPPYIHGMRAIPTDMTDMWALELDIEYSGDAALHVEARLEELDLKNNILDPEGRSVEEVTTDLLEGIEHLEEDLKLSSGSNNRVDQHDGKSRSLKSSASTVGSRWKSMFNSVAKQLSQVPFTLGIRVTSLKGALQLRVKPPPSDQLWFGFTSMPDINFDLESFVGERKVTSTHIALFLVNRFKAAVQETLVLPNCESICVPWMLAEKDDWIPRSAAPLIWLKREPTNSSNANEGSTSQSGEQKTKIETGKSVEVQERRQQYQQKVNSVKEDTSECGHTRSSSAGSINTSSKTLNDVRVPLVQNDAAREFGSQALECHSPSTNYVSLKAESTNLVEGERAKRTGRTARMFDLGKKVTEKLEEKRRVIEERSRHIVEKMRNHEPT